MNCEMIKEKIDLLTFEENKQLNTEVLSHIENCDECNSYYLESLRAKGIIRQMQKEPELPDPEDLTKDILSLIDDIDQAPKLKNSKSKVFLLIRRSLAAASICLILVFGIEQYMVFDKISKMEEHVSYISTEHKAANLYNIINYNLGFHAETMNKLFTENLIGRGHLNLKSRIIRTRLSALANNKLDFQSMNQIIREVSTRNFNNTN